MTTTANMIDISSYQDSTAPDWSAIKAAGIKHVIIKATELVGTSGNRQDSNRSHSPNVSSTLYVNPYLRRDAQAAAKAGLSVGYYFFAHPGSTSPKAATLTALRAVKGLPRGHGMTIDIEVQEGLSWRALANWTKHARRWALIWKPWHYTIAPVYSSESFLANMGAFTWKRVPLWIAAYGPSTPPHPCWAWQFSGSGHVNGIDGEVDLDVFYGRR